MKIYLMRHGEAAFNKANDDDRELTDNGRAKVLANVLLKKAELSAVQSLLSSPICRAMQTASLACEVLGRRSDTIQQVNWLIHESQPLKSIAALSRIDADAVMLFSHQPFASRFTEILCDLELGAVAMNTASIIAMEADTVVAGGGKVLWQLP